MIFPVVRIFQFLCQSRQDHSGKPVSLRDRIEAAAAPGIVGRQGVILFRMFRDKDDRISFGIASVFRENVLHDNFFKCQHQISGGCGIFHDFRAVVSDLFNDPGIIDRGRRNLHAQGLELPDKLPCLVSPGVMINISNAIIIVSTLFIFMAFITPLR